MTQRRRAVRIKLGLEWPYHFRCFNCFTGRMSVQWTDIHIYHQDMRGAAYKCDRCGEILFDDRMADFAARKAGVTKAYLVIDAKGMRIEEAA